MLRKFGNSTTDDASDGIDDQEADSPSHTPSSHRFILNPEELGGSLVTAPLVTASRVRPPSLREIAQQLRSSPSTAARPALASETVTTIQLHRAANLGPQMPVPGGAEAEHESASQVGSDMVEAKH